MGFLSKLFGQPSAAVPRTPSAQVNAGKLALPSWMADREKIMRFVNGAQDLAVHHGVPKLFSAQIMSQKEIMDSIIGLAGSMEQQGASFNEQQVAVANKLIEFYNMAD